ncbi:uncharacterized protein STEHIDRAFT_48583 [Stereum hirsutum FP-91666 SS1]|uniref:uncharacterized protein n=1 Tax=Stereum hirsutum (strain FP-91666) TaxID=721885 RepID=UPI000440C94D|nr:uncharacterized protein STEHIDRAFT_48583 [Stereum hirsutum FP-91666 SS1]EIM91099.1 hypothetical protein STEHIDRAFT_48583 [Stereum hirsutum FP-91666 SS1]
MNPSSLSKRGDQKQELPYELPDPQKQMDNARLLSKYVFPRQYGLASVFTLDPWIVQSQQGPTYADRTEEIKVCCYRKWSCKTPTRVKPVLALLEKMIWMNGKCNPKALRDLACPSKVPLTSRPRYQVN